MLYVLRRIGNEANINLEIVPLAVVLDYKKRKYDIARTPTVRSPIIIFG